MALLIGYASLCVVVALYGRKCRIGFWGVLLTSALLTPVLVFYGLLGLRPAVIESRDTKPLTKKSWWKSNQVV